jgi:hypothetical protein
MVETGVVPAGWIMALDKAKRPELHQEPRFLNRSCNTSISRS